MNTTSRTRGIIGAILVALFAGTLAAAIDPITSNPIPASGDPTGPSGGRRLRARGVGVAMIGSSDVLSSRVTPGLGASRFEVECAMTTAQTLYYTVYDGSTTKTVALNGGTALTANASTTLSFSVNPTYTYNFQTSGGTTLNLFILTELSGSCARAPSGSGGGGGSVTWPLTATGILDMASYNIEGAGLIKATGVGDDVELRSGLTGGSVILTCGSAGEVQCGGDLAMTATAGGVVRSGNNKTLTLVSPDNGGGTATSKVVLDATADNDVRLVPGGRADVEGTLRIAVNGTSGALQLGATGDTRLYRSGVNTATFDNGAGGSATAIFTGNTQTTGYNTLGTADANGARFTVAAGVVDVIGGGGTGHPIFRAGALKVDDGSGGDAIHHMTGGTRLGSALGVYWSSTAVAGGSLDLGVERSAAGILKLTDGSTGYGRLKAYQCSFFAYKTSTATISNNTQTTVICDTETEDTGTNHNVSTGEFTAPVAGLYYFRGASYYQTTAPGAGATLRLYNSTTLKVWAQAEYPNVADVNREVTGCIRLAASDVVVFQVYQNSGGDRTIYGAADSRQWTSFQGHLVCGQ